MDIKTIKQKMKSYTDFYGGDLISSGEIDEAKTKQQLAALLENHRHFMEDMLSDANSHLDHFKKELELHLL